MEIIGIILCFLQALLLNYVLVKNFPYKFEPVHKWIIQIGFAAALGSADYFLFHSGQGFAKYFFALLLIYEVYMQICMKGRKSTKFFLSLILLVYKILLVAIGDMAAIRLIGGEQPLNGLAHVFSQTVVVLLLVPIAVFLVHFRLPEREQQLHNWSALACVISLIIMLSLLSLVLTIPDSVSNPGYNVCMILIMTACYYLLYRLMKSFCQELDYQVELELHQYEQEYNKQIRTAYEKLRSLRHDFKNHILYMGAMLQEEEYGELQLYFKELADWTEDARNMIDTGNQLANAVLNVKMISAAEENIPVTINASLPDKMPVSDIEFVSLLGNLFDNALEASRKAATPYIRIQMEPYKGFIRMEFENKMDRPFLNTKNGLQTDKKDKEEHGMGMGIMRDIVERNKGNFYCLAENGSFLVRILLPREERSETFI